MATRFALLLTLHRFAAIQVPEKKQMLFICSSGSSSSSSSGSGSSGSGSSSGYSYAAVLDLREE